MKIKEILTQHRRDFTAIFICEHCGHEEKGGGYDDNFFHSNVIPSLECKSCGLRSPENYRPLTTKYQSWETV